MTKQSAPIEGKEFSIVKKYRIGNTCYHLVGTKDPIFYMNEWHTVYEDQGDLFIIVNGKIEVLVEVPKPIEGKEPLGITPGEWKVDKSSLNLEFKEVRSLIDGSFARVCKSHKIDNLDAICKAVNSTYKRGINPESIEGLYENVQNLLFAFRSSAQSDIQKKAIEYAQSALESAKLK